MFMGYNKMQSIKLCQLSTVIFIVRGSCLLGGCVYLQFGLSYTLNPYGGVSCMRA